MFDSMGSGLGNVGVFDGQFAGAVWRLPAGKRGAFLLGRLVDGPGRTSVRGLGIDRAGEMRITRFLRNPKVTVAEMVRTAAARTATRVAGLHILAVQDTTSLRDDGDGGSINLHPMIALDAQQGALLGLISAEVLVRDGQPNPTPLRKRRHTEKQSRRWVEAAHEAAKLLAAGAASVTMVADREGDFYEDFALRPAGVQVLVRAEQNRILSDGSKLFARVAAQPVLGRTATELPAAPGRAARKISLDLRACTVELRRPLRCAADRELLPQHLTLSVVEALEVDPPAGSKAAHWYLLTTHDVQNFADASRIVAHYRERWVIEQLFRTLKTRGFDIEALRITETQPFATLCVAALIAAIQVMQMVRDRDGLAGRPLDDAFDPADLPMLRAVNASLEGKTERQKNPHPPGSLAYAAWICGRLGGWNCYYGKPGPIVTYNGLLQLRAIRRGWELRKLV